MIKTINQAGEYMRKGTEMTEKLCYFINHCIILSGILCSVLSTVEETKCIQKQVTKTTRCMESREKLLRERLFALMKR